MTAHYLVNDMSQLARLNKDEYMVIQAVAGGTGTKAQTIAKILGFKVIGTCSEGKHQIAESNGCDIVCR